MEIDKKIVYQTITALRERAKETESDYDNILMRGSANIMEGLIRAYLDLVEENKRREIIECH